jgi:hypothetical protein
MFSLRGFYEISYITKCFYYTSSTSARYMQLKMFISYKIYTTCHVFL